MAVEDISCVEWWRGSWGNEYLERNNVAWQQRIPFFRRLLESTNAMSFLDVGTNAGWNLLALREIDGGEERMVMSGIEPNARALTQAIGHGFDVIDGTAGQAAELFGLGVADLVMTSGVLIHIPPEGLEQAMRSIRDASRQYVLAVEYMAEVETEVEYRGHEGRLWKRNYGDLYAELGMSLVESGIAEGFDSCHYVLMEK